MLNFRLEIKEKIPIKDFVKMPLIDIMNDDRHFTIFVDDQTFFDDIYFPIREFIKYALDWSKNSTNNFIYNTVDSNENPLLSFCKLKDGWKLESVWQKFECNNIFTKNEVKTFISEIVSHILA